MLKKIKRIEAVSVFQSSSITGYVLLKELSNDKTKIEVHVQGLPPNKSLGFHIHEGGDLRCYGKDTPCQGACAHYNPFKKHHGGPRSKEKHVGDLGNLRSDANGNSTTTITLSSVKLRGKYSVIGRSIVIHEKNDDLGKAGTEDSMKTGSSGARIACGVIGYTKDSLLYF